MEAEEIILPKPNARSITTYIAAYRKYYLKDNNFEEIDANLKRNAEQRMIQNDDPQPSKTPDSE